MFLEMALKLKVQGWAWNYFIVACLESLESLEG
jgi:hypothetical protein